MIQQWFDLYMSEKFTATLNGYSANLENQAKTIQEMNYANHILCRKMQEEFDDVRSLNELEDFLRKYNRITANLVDDYVAKNNYMQRVIQAGNTVGTRLYELSDELYNIDSIVPEEEKAKYPNLTEAQIVDIKKANSFQIANQHIQNNKNVYKQFAESVIKFESVSPPTCSVEIYECCDMLSSYKIISRFSARGYEEQETEEILNTFGSLNGLLCNLESLNTETNKYYYLMGEQQQGLDNMKKSYNLVHEFRKKQLQTMQKQESVAEKK